MPLFFICGTLAAALKKKMLASDQKTYTKDDLVQWYGRGYEQGFNNAASKTIELIQNLVNECENPSAKAVPPSDK